MNTRIALLPLALVSAMAIAKETPTAAWERALVRDEGMILITDGLYMQSSASGASYVAINAAGREALRGIVRHELDTQRARLKVKGADRRVAGIVASLARAVEDLGSEYHGKVSSTGSCADGSVQYARALSSGGTSASAFTVSDASFPPVTTFHAVEAVTDTIQQSQTSIGGPASASAYEPTSCQAYAVASITCLNDTSPTVFAFAQSASKSAACVK